MTDLLWSIEMGDMVLQGSGSTIDFVVSTSPATLSTQNAGIILIGRGFNISAPNYGISVSEIINGSITNAAFQMNRWKSQVLADGARTATWNYKNALQVYEWDASYV